MIFQKKVNGRGEFEKRAAHRAAGQGGLIFNAQLQPGFFGRQGLGFRSQLIFDAFGFPLFHYLHERSEGVETAGKAGVGVKLHQYFLDPVDCQASIKTRI